MDAGRQLVRYSLPGGLFAIIATFVELAFHWAWRERLNSTFTVLSESALLTATGIVLLGFVLYQLYYATYRPVLRVPWSQKPIYTHDRGGAVLEGLRDVPGAFEAIKRSHGVTDDIGYLPPGKPDDGTYHDQWYRNAHVVRSLINSIATSGGFSEIKRDYVALTDIYHALGACRIAIGLASLATATHIAVSGGNRMSHHPLRCVAVAVTCTGLVWITYKVCHRNRKDTYHTMTKGLSTDLRLWWLGKHPDTLPPCP